MKWKQRFGRARKTGTFNRNDLETAYSWPDCAVGDMLRSRGYNQILTSRTLAEMIYRNDAVLEEMGCCFYNVVKRSERMPMCRKIYNTDDEYREENIDLINDAQEIYDEIQNMEPSQALIDKLGLKATLAAA